MQASTITWGGWGERRLALAIALLAGILAVSLLYSPIPLALLVGVPACFYFMSRPYELLLWMVFLIPFNFVFSVGSIPVAAELLKVFAWIPFLVCFSARKGPFTTSKYNWCFAVLAGLLVLSVFRSQDLPFTVKESVRLASNIGLCYLVLNLVDSQEKVLQIFRVLTFSTFLVACYGFYQFAIQDFGALFWIVNPRLDTSLAPNRVAFWQWRNRIISVLTSEQELAHYFNLCLPVGVLLWLKVGGGRIRSRWLLMTVASLVGLLLTFTFGAWLALAATLALFALLLDKKRLWKPMLLTAVVLSLLTSVLVFGPLRPFLEAKALGTGVGGLAFDIVGRLDSWAFALQVWRSHPLVGVGVGSFEGLEYAHELIHVEWVQNGSTPSNAYLYFLAITGIIGLTAILVVLLGTIRTNLRMRRNPELGLIALALAFAITTAMFGSLTDDGPLFGAHASYLVWLLVGLSEAVRNVVVPVSDRLASA